MTVLVAYATRHGSTAGIAGRIAATLQAEGLAAEARPVAQVRDVAPDDAVVLGGAASMYHWLQDATAFAEHHRAELRRRPVGLASSGPLGTDRVDTEGHDVLEAGRPQEFDQLSDLLQPRGSKSSSARGTRTHRRADGASGCSAPCRPRRTRCRPATSATGP